MSRSSLQALLACPCLGHASMSYLSCCEWASIARLCRAWAAAVRSFVRRLREFDAGSHPKMDLVAMARACVGLRHLCLHGRTFSSSTDLSDGVLAGVARRLPRLVKLDLRSCGRRVTDSGLRAVFESCVGLRSFRIEDGERITDGPFALVPVSLEELHMEACYNTPQLLVHLGGRCPGLRVLRFHVVPNLDHGSVPLHSLFARLISLKELHCRHVIVDDILLASLALLPALSSVDLYLRDDGSAFSNAGLANFVRHRAGALAKLTLARSALTDQGLASICDECINIKKIRLCGLPSCVMGDAARFKLPRSLIELCLDRCHLYGILDCTSLPTLRRLWLFGNLELRGVRGSGQPLEKLNIWQTRCSSISTSGFSFEALTFLDLADLQLGDAALQSVLMPAAHALKCLVIDGNSPSTELASNFIKKAACLECLNVVGCPEEAVAALVAGLAVTSCAPMLEVLQVSKRMLEELQESERVNLSGLRRQRPQLAVVEEEYLTRDVPYLPFWWA